MEKTYNINLVIKSYPNDLRNWKGQMIDDLLSAHGLLRYKEYFDIERMIEDFKKDLPIEVIDDLSITQDKNGFYVKFKNRG